MDHHAGHTGTSESSSMSSMSSMPMSMPMQMTFFTSTSTPLYSSAFTPHSTGQYAGVCIFLIILSLVLRLLYALKCRLEARWHTKDLRRRYIITQPIRAKRGSSKHTDERIEEKDAVDSDGESDVLRADKGQDGTLTVNGVDSRVRVVQTVDTHTVQPFRLSVDVVRAVFVTVLVGVSYLLMLAVMTMNVGYFMSVLAGAFVGELCFGRFAPNAGDGH